MIVTKKITVIDQVRTGENAKEYRNKAGLTLREVAKRMNISIGYLSDLEHGRKKWTTELITKFQESI